MSGPQAKIIYTVNVWDNYLILGIGLYVYKKNKI